MPNFKEKLELYKKEFSNSNILVSEETYVELRSKPEHEMSLKEYLQVKVYESLDKYQREVDNLRRENDELAEINMQLKLKSDRDQREVDSMRKLVQEREEDSRRRLDAQERRVKDLEGDLHRANQQIKVYQEKGFT